jgi:hypothetical protein
MLENTRPAAIERRYGALAVLDFSDPPTRKRYLCRCDCGKVVEVPTEALEAGEILTCGRCRAASATPDARADSFASNVADLEGCNAWKRHRGAS